MLLITHNFGIVSDLAERVYVMQQGKVVESGDTEQVLSRPEHPYTQSLMAAVPRLHNRGE